MSKNSDINNKDFSIIGEITEDGQYIRIAHFESLRRIFKKFIGKQLEVNFKLLKYQRSAAQNRWLWGVAYPTIAAFHKESTGEVWDKNAIHNHTLRNILDYKLEWQEVNGQEQPVFKGKSTSILNTKEFADMVENLVKYWDELGCPIPLPKPKGHNFLTDFLEDN